MQVPDASGFASQWNICLRDSEVVGPRIEILNFIACPANTGRPNNVVYWLYFGHVMIGRFKDVPIMLR